MTPDSVASLPFLFCTCHSLQCLIDPCQVEKKQMRQVVNRSWEACAVWILLALEQQQAASLGISFSLDRLHKYSGLCTDTISLTPLTWKSSIFRYSGYLVQPS
jgi:antirestriction protein